METARPRPLHRLRAGGPAQICLRLHRRARFRRSPAGVDGARHPAFHPEARSARPAHGLSDQGGLLAGKRGAMISRPYAATRRTLGIADKLLEVNWGLVLLIAIIAAGGIA